MNDGNQQPTAPQSSRVKIALLAALAVLVVIVAVLLITNSSDDKPTTDTALPPSTESTLPPVEAKVLADYRAFWDAYLAASNPMRPDHPALQAHATGPELKQLVEGFTGSKIDNEVFKGTIDLNPKITSLNGNDAVVRDCLFDNGGVYDATTGSRKDAPDTQRQLNVVNLTLIDGTWKVSSVVKESVGCSAP